MPGIFQKFIWVCADDPDKDYDLGHICYEPMPDGSMKAYAIVNELGEKFMKSNLNEEVLKN